MPSEPTRKGLRWLVTEFFKGRFKTASAYDLADGVDRVVKHETGRTLDELRDYTATVPEAPIEQTSFVEKWAREQELSEQQRGAIKLGHDMNEIMTRKR